MSQLFRIMSFNIRYASANDGANNWEKRASAVVEVIQKSRASIILVQEALNFQLDYIQQHLGGWSRLGVGRDDGCGAGEHCAILYHHHEWQWKENNTFWLSDTPHQPGSRSWNTALPRICTWAKMHHVQHDRDLYVFNTHLDHKSTAARKNAAKLIRHHIENVSAEFPVVLCGDFNESLRGEAVRELCYDDFLRSAWATVYPQIKKPGTFHDFVGVKNGLVIDHILINQQIDVRNCEIDGARYQNRYPSDHFPIIIEFAF
ncbi:endonuclease/exonuclease/phosphatase family protein [Candidatus Uabimicrobium amorphum]|uniref:Endonuclease n=1 Tax=Uabimicrobium amorphum TaxID=2596890 RepID=A0A5S9IM26_UABAM|nr:endonuclease/exonuclease/phosphatase family protein [Candidatus Uabimicrobium amorphum]BBM84388.1 endonuclease [Candidatus Uabimicrobium amorphum]